MNIRKMLGWLLFVLCCLSFFVVVTIPFLGFTKAEAASYMAGFYVFSQITWWLSVPLLGKEVLNWMKNIWAGVKENLFAKEKSANDEC